MKLPEIQHRTAQAYATISPGQAAAPHLEKIKLTQQIGEMALNVNELSNKLNVNNANADYTQAISNFKRGMATRTEPFTQEQLDEMGIGDKIDASEGPVAKWEVYNVALSQYMDDMREQHGGQIRSQKHRDAWKQDTELQSLPELERAVQDAANMAVDEMTNEQVRRAKAALVAGEYDVARQAYDNPIFKSNPALKKVRDQAMIEITKAEYKESEQDLITEAQNMAAAGRTEEAAADLDAMAAEHRTGEKVEGSPWTDEEHNAWASRLEAQATAVRASEKVRDSEVKAAEAEQYDKALDVYWQQNYDDPEALLTNMPANLKDQDIRSIVSFAKKKAGSSVIKTDVPTWDMLTTMATNNPEEFRSVNLLRHMDSLSISAYQSFRDKQLELEAQSRGEVSVPNYLTNEQLYGEAYAHMSIDGSGRTDKNSRFVMAGIFASELDREERARATSGKAAMSLPEKQSLINDITMFQLTKNNRTRKNVPFEDMKDEDMASLAAAVTGAGFAVTAENAYDANQLMDKDIPVNRDTIIAAMNLREDGMIVNNASVNSWIERARELGRL